MAQRSGDAGGVDSRAKKIRVRLVRSTIGVIPRQRATVRALGLRKIHSSREHEASPAVLGMIKAVAHLVKVEELPNT